MNKRAGRFHSYSAHHRADGLATGRRVLQPVAQGPLFPESPPHMLRPSPHALRETRLPCPAGALCTERQRSARSSDPCPSRPAAAPAHSRVSMGQARAQLRPDGIFPSFPLTLTMVHLDHWHYCHWQEVGRNVQYSLLLGKQGITLDMAMV